MKNRIIKFRAWADSTKEMIPWQEAMFPEWLEDEDITLMQFTGLIDKDGTEIYEGDIVINNQYGYSRKPRVVEWVTSFHSAGLVVSGFKIGMGYYPEEENHKKTMQVIGNIYENPNLLNPNA